MLKKTLKGGFAPPALSTLTQPELSSVLGGPNAQAVGDCWQGGGCIINIRFVLSRAVSPSVLASLSLSLSALPPSFPPSLHPTNFDDLPQATVDVVS